MTQRSRLLVELVKELVGPRNGPQEVLPDNQNPRDEYLAGVLAPAETAADHDLDSEVTEIAAGVDASEEDEDEAIEITANNPMAPSLDPKSQPRSIGITFVVQTQNAQPTLEICAVWARYYPDPEGWQRRPDYFLSGNVNLNDRQTFRHRDEVEITVRTRRLENGIRISVFLLNCRTPAGARAETPDFIFQPQIRIKLSEGMGLLPVRRTFVREANDIPGALDDRNLEILYADKSGMARGHMCSAMWGEIDPERPFDGSIERPNAAPFIWTDQDVVPPADRQKFLTADVRTEITPIYNVDSPTAEWSAVWGPEPELLADALAEFWDPGELAVNLGRLCDGYESWIVRQQRAVQNLDADDRPLVQQNIARCEYAARRMRDAIGLLRTDEKIRLAFCFANKAMGVQSRWARGRPLKWKPFQLAFLLLCIPSLSDRYHADRNICDLLWFPTGGGKTEAYLAVAAFVLGLRRLRRENSDDTGGGTAVLSRYTLRLLTIQQFRRTLGLITACEALRVKNLNQAAGPVGWRPNACRNRETFLWGGCRFSAGLWVGGNVTPNALVSIDAMREDQRIIRFVGALEILRGARRDYNGPDQRLANSLRGKLLDISGEPAQVTNCPCCASILAISHKGLGPGRHTLHFHHNGGRIGPMVATAIAMPGAAAVVNTGSCIATPSLDFPDGRTSSIEFIVRQDEMVTDLNVDEWWHQIVAPQLGANVELLSARPCRPGYFITTSNNAAARETDFEIFCPNPVCELNNTAWAEQVPFARDSQPLAAGQRAIGGTGAGAQNGLNALPLLGRLQWQHGTSSVSARRTQYILNRIPIPACTVDEQVYSRCPSFVIATVDKFARLAFEPRAAGLFGNVDHYHSIFGYYRAGAAPQPRLPDTPRPHPPGGPGGRSLHTPVSRFRSPELVIQDELHLIEGPLGSMVGIYETAIDELCTTRVGDRSSKPKYIASTATIRHATEQVQSIFRRTSAQFPPSAVTADNRFFAVGDEAHPLSEDSPGRLYVGISAPGKGAQTPIIRIWTALLQHAYLLHQQGPGPRSDRFWTLVGYFNAIRELAGASSLYRQDILERLTFRYGAQARTIDPERYMELSGRANSLELPSLLQELSIVAPDAPDAVLATSMFGTGVDVDRLGLMVVHGQPKSTASYIQATGRVGRQSGGLVVTFLRAARPRDLDHYEFFAGYHRSLYRYVEPVTVAPFAPRARDRALGPICVAALRQAATINGVAVDDLWRVQQRLMGAFHSEANRMATHRHDAEVRALTNLMESGANQQPAARRPVAGIVSAEVGAELDRWQILARATNNRDRFVYNEPAALRTPQRGVVLGDAQHSAQNLPQVYESAPQSLREVDATTTLKG